MDENGRRKAPRIKLGTTPATLYLNGGSAVGRVLDISRTGALLDGCTLGGEKGKVAINGSTVIVRDCDVVRKDEPRLAVAFTPPLSHQELGLIVDGYDPAMTGESVSLAALAQRDEEAVRSEIRAIQACRSNIFLATLGTIGAAVVTIGTLVIENKLQPPAVLFGISVAFGLFLVGILATIEKARAINVRKGFLRALSAQRVEGRLRNSYPGWCYISDILWECGYRDKLGVCNRKRQAKTGGRCKDEGMMDAAAFNKVTHLSGDLFGSFMSLSSFIYASIYILFILAFAYYLPPAILPVQTNDAFVTATTSLVEPPSILQPVRLGLPFGFGIAVGLAIGRWRKFVVPIFITTCILFLAGAISSEPPTYHALVFLVGVLLGAIGWYFVKQVDSCRRDKHSITTYFYTWDHVLSYCTFKVMNPRELTPPTQRGLRKWFNSSLAWMFEQKSSTLSGDRARR